MKVKAMSYCCGKSLVSACLLLTACTATSPAARHDAAAARLGLEAGEIRGDGFSHRTYSSRALVGERANAGRTLFVYFGGDGTPFVRRNAVARDPTPRKPLALALLARGPQPAVFLGRPCYHGLVEGCDPALWTVGRYSEAVVGSMAAATRELLQAGGHEAGVLVGYSGGGVLALMVAERLPAVKAVVTLAANLDLGAWTELHGYSPLSDSINPLTAAGSRDDLRHLHLTGALDANVPPDVQKRLEAKLGSEAFATLPGFDHRCCWVDSWPALLDDRLCTTGR